MREFGSSKGDYSKSIAEVVKNHLDSNNWQYMFDEEQGIIITYMNIGGKINKIQMSINIYDTDLTIHFVIPFRIEEKDRAKISEYINRVNYDMKNGNFEMNFANGEIRFKVYIQGYKTEITDMLIKVSIFVGITMVRRYGAGILDILFGTSTPEQAVGNINKHIKDEIIAHLTNSIYDDDDDDEIINDNGNCIDGTDRK